MSTEKLLDAALELANAVSFDMHGAMMGGKLIGGNGGLISDKTLRAADALRRAIDAERKKQ